MANKLHIKKGDTVMVIAGGSKGHKGKVMEVFPEKNRAIVEGASLMVKHTRPSAKNQEGGRIKKESPIHISNLMVIDPVKGIPTRIGRRKNAKGVTVRYAKKSDKDID